MSLPKQSYPLASSRQMAIDIHEENNEQARHKGDVSN